LQMTLHDAAKRGNVEQVPNPCLVHFVCTVCECYENLWILSYSDMLIGLALLCAG
jgi:hypothetical protein